MPTDLIVSRIGMKITVKHLHDKKVCAAVWNGLLEYNLQFAQRNHKEFTISVSTGKKVIGGAIGETKFGWTIVLYLWIDKRYRGRQLGTKIMNEVDKVAVLHNSVGIWLDTFSFQAPLFYKKLGYKKIGVLKDHPFGYSKYWFAKRIAANKSVQRSP